MTTTYESIRQAATAPVARVGTQRSTGVGAAHLDAVVEAAAGFRGMVAKAELWGERLARVLPQGGRLLAAGNGGSAAQAQHLTAELVGRYRFERQPLSAICLSAETSSLTAIANDYPPEELFARQVEAHGRPGDVVALLSTSGNSANIVAAAERARECGLTVWGFTGAGPNRLTDVAHDVICVDTPLTATVQELHLVALHVVCEALDAALGITPRSCA